MTRLVWNDAFPGSAAEQPRIWAPRAVVVVDAIPLLDNGKVDRLALKELW